MVEIYKTTYSCEVVTPVFIYGAEFLELRTSSLKGLLRYWWRALNGHLPLEELRKKEGQLFGSSEETAGRSPVVLRFIQGKMPTSNEYLLPHKEKAPIGAYKIGSQFQIVVMSMGTSDKHTRYENIVEAALLLGGLGKRVRRGFGSAAIITKENTKMGKNKNNNDSMNYAAPQDLPAILTLLNSVNNGRFSIQENKIISNGFAGNYPYVKTVELGKPYNSVQELLVKVGTTTHNVSRGGSDYTGFSRKQGKLSSPVYITILKIGPGYHPLVTTLNTVFDPEHRPRGTDKQKTLKDEIL